MMDNNIKVSKGGSVDELPDNVGYKIGVSPTSITIPSNLPLTRTAYGMFMECYDLISADLSNFNTSQINNMNNMFYNCSDLSSITFGSNFDTSLVTSMGNMFYGCSSLTTLDLSNFNTPSLTEMYSMFKNCSKLSSITFGSNFDTSLVTRMGDMFYGCSSLTTLDLSNFNTAPVHNFEYMFSYCKNLSSIIFGSNFNTSSATNMFYMFYGCSSLTTLDLSQFDFTKVVRTQYSNGFSNMLTTNGTCTVYVKSEDDKTLLTNNASPSSGVTIVVKS